MVVKSLRSLSFEDYVWLASPAYVAMSGCDGGIRQASLSYPFLLRISLVFVCCLVCLDSCNSIGEPYGYRLRMMTVLCHWCYIGYGGLMLGYVPLMT